MKTIVLLKCCSVLSWDQDIMTSACLLCPHLLTVFCGTLAEWLGPSHTLQIAPACEHQNVRSITLEMPGWSSRPVLLVV